MTDGKIQNLYFSLIWKFQIWAFVLWAYLKYELRADEINSESELLTDEKIQYLSFWLKNMRSESKLLTETETVIFELLTDKTI